MTVPEAAAVSAETAGDEVKRPWWYKRRGWLVSAALIAVVGATVLVDRSHHSSRSSQIAADSKVMSQVNSNVAPCGEAVGKAIAAYRVLTVHSLTPLELGRAPGLLRQDLVACTLRDDSTYQLSIIEVPETASGRDVGKVVRTVTVWATSDAAATIEQVQALVSNPSDALAKQLLVHDEQLLAHDRALAVSELDAANALLQTKLPALRLPQLPISAS
jgi:hypothetical protein